MFIAKCLLIPYVYYFLMDLRWSKWYQSPSGEKETRKIFWLDKIVARRLNAEGDHLLEKVTLCELNARGSRLLLLRMEVVRRTPTSWK